MTIKSSYVKGRLIDIQAAITKAKSASTDPEIAAYLARYLAVYICGVYEDCIETLFIERAGKSKDPEMKSFVAASIDTTFRNPNYETIKDLLKKFNSGHQEKFRKLLSDKAIEAINSIKTNKDQVAHGKECSATLNDIEDYFNRSMILFDVLEQILGL